MKAWNNIKKKKGSQKFSQNSQTLKMEALHVESDIFYTLVPIGYVSRVCGLLPVKLTRNKLDPTSRTEMQFVAYGITLALALTGAEIWGLYRELHDDWENSTSLSTHLGMAVTILVALVVIILTCLAILGSVARWEHVLQALHKIIQADEKLDFTTTKDLRKSSVILIACTLTFLICLSILNYASMSILYTYNPKKISDKGPINYCPLYLIFMVIVTLEMQYAVILMNLGERFTKINSTIEKLIETNATIDYFRNDMGFATREPRRATSQTFVSANQRRQYRINSGQSSIDGLSYGRDVTEPITQLIKVYDLLCDSVVHLNEAFGLPFLICTISCLINIVITLYFMFADYNKTNQRWYMLVRQSAWASFFIYKLLLFVEPPYLVVSKARNTGSLVSQALAIEWNPQAQQQLENFATQLLHRPIEFTASGLFYLDRGLITSIAGTAATYLAILVQFHTSSNNKISLLSQTTSVQLKNVSKVRIS